MKKNILSILLVVVLLFSLENVAYASEEEIVIEYELQIYPETQAIIDNTVSQCHVDAGYFNNLIDLYRENGYSDSDYLNDALIDAANAINATYVKNENDLQMAIKEYNQTVKNNSMTRAGIDINTYNSVIENYGVGCLAARAIGCTHTADSMEHAVVPIEKVGTGWTPSALNYNGDDWAVYLCTRTGLWSVIEGRFQGEVLENNYLMYTMTGTYSFNTSNSSLDAYLQLHSVNYSVTFVKIMAEYGGYYTASFYLNDVYDFDWSGYDNIIVGFANNYAYMAQSLGVIAPYPIYCTFEM